MPLEDFNRAGPDWQEVLCPHGWQLVRTAGVVRYWRRPGKYRGCWSATTGYCRSGGCDLLHVFSSNAPPFGQGGSYSRFRAYALLNHDGDYRAAAGELALLGFGAGAGGSARASPAWPLRSPGGHGPPPHQGRGLRRA